LFTENSGEATVFRFQAEQVSHNPPISAFHLECPQQNISLQGNVSVQAKFMGMYVGITLGTGKNYLILNNYLKKLHRINPFFKW
jgi:hypothetical protein